MDGYQAFRAQQFEKAREKFMLLLEHYPGNEYSNDAYFWIGECYYYEKKYIDAILHYEDFLKIHPESDKAPGALLKESLALYELKNKQSGNKILEKLIEKFPNSREAPEAKQILKK